MLMNYKCNISIIIIVRVSSLSSLSILFGGKYKKEKRQGKGWKAGLLTNMGMGTSKASYDICFCHKIKSKTTLPFTSSSHRKSCKCHQAGPHQAHSVLAHH
jgi:hypothetical protein